MTDPLDEDDDVDVVPLDVVVVPEALPVVVVVPEALVVVVPEALDMEAPVDDVVPEALAIDAPVDAPVDDVVPALDDAPPVEALLAVLPPLPVAELVGVPDAVLLLPPPVPPLLDPQPTAHTETASAADTHKLFMLLRSPSSGWRAAP